MQIVQFRSLLLTSGVAKNIQTNESRKFKIPPTVGWSRRTICSIDEFVNYLGGLPMLFKF